MLPDEAAEGSEGPSSKAKAKPSRVPRTFQDYKITLGKWDKAKQQDQEWGLLLYYKGRLVARYMKVGDELRRLGWWPEWQMATMNMDEDGGPKGCRTPNYR